MEVDCILSVWHILTEQLLFLILNLLDVLFYSFTSTIVVFHLIWGFGYVKYEKLSKTPKFCHHSSVGNCGNLFISWNSGCWFYCNIMLLKWKIVLLALKFPAFVSLGLCLLITFGSSLNVTMSDYQVVAILCLAVFNYQVFSATIETRNWNASVVYKNASLPPLHQVCFLAISLKLCSSFILGLWLCEPGQRGICWLKLEVNKTRLEIQSIQG